MKAHEYRSRFVNEFGKLRHADVLDQIIKDFEELLDNGGRNNIRGFENAVNAIKMKWDSIYQGGDHYKKGWNYFFATVIAKKRELWFPDEMKKRREERARQKEDQYKREMYERLRRSYESRAAGSFYRGGFNRGGFYRGESEKFDSASKEESRRKAAEEWERLWQTIINDSYFYTSSGGKRNQHFYEWNFTAKRNDELSFREAKEFMELQNYSFISPEMIKSQYRKLAKKYHPDCGGNGEDFKKLAKAKETLERGY